MIKVEAEEIFVAAVMSDSTTLVALTLPETQVFRVLVGRIMKEMEVKNKSLWSKARGFGVEYKDGFCIIKKIDSAKYKMFRLNDKGELVEFDRSLVFGAEPKIDVAEEEVVNETSVANE
jgi:hypothetical protein